jgi:hypothetical protein
MTAMDKNRWIDEVMNSLEGAQRAEAPPMLFEKIVSRINKARVEVLPSKVVWLAAASILIIISANVLLLRASSQSPSQKDPYQLIVNDYQLNTTNPLSGI